MPQFNVTSPDGKSFVVTAPDGATQDQVLAYAKSQFAQKTAAQPAPEASGLDKALGVLKNAAGSVLEPAGAMVTGAVNPFLGKVAGLVGNAANAVGATDKTGADWQDATNKMFPTYQPQTTAGKAVTGAIGKAADIAIGAPARQAGQWAGQGARALGAGDTAADAAQNGVTEAVNQIPNVLGAKVPEGAAARIANTADDAAKAAPRTAAVQNALDAGYHALPTDAPNAPVGKLLQSIAGKDQATQTLTHVNQDVTNSLAAQDVGMKSAMTKSQVTALKVPVNQAYDAIRTADQNVVPLTDVEGKPVLSASGKPKYGVAGPALPDAEFSQDVQGIAGRRDGNLTSGADAQIAKIQAQLANPTSPTPSGWLTDLKKLRSDSRANSSAKDDPDKLALGDAQSNAADAVEGLLQRYLQRTGQTELYNQFTAARTQGAKLNSIDDAMSADGRVDAADLARQRAAGRFMGGNLAKIADAAETLPTVVRNTDKVPKPTPISKLQLMLMAPAMLGGEAVGGHMGGAASVAALTAPMAARKALASQGYQASMRASGAQLPQPSPLTQLAAQPASPLAALAIPREQSQDGQQ